jgi:hypothetical protein
MSYVRRLGSKLAKKIRELPHVSKKPGEFWDEGEDGYWLVLEDGWSMCDNDVHCLHEWTLTDLYWQARHIKPCRDDCECKKEMAHE